VTDLHATGSGASLGELGGYQLLERVGAGALGEVFRARDTVHGRTVALKRVPAALMADDERMGLLRDTALALTQVSHPGVAMLYECGDEDGQSFLAQEFVPGQSLTQVLAGRPINALRAVDLAVRIADSLAVLHSAGLTHGDLRPDNIVVTPKGQVKLLDTGLASFTGGGAVRASAHKGSVSAASLPVVRYLAPEEALGESGDHRADLFALGLVLYEMLTGQPAFGRPRGDDTLVAILRDPAPVPSKKQANLPLELDRIVARAIAKPVGDRYQAAGQLADDLRAVKVSLDDELDQSGAFEPEPKSCLWWWVLALAGAAGVITWLALRLAS
jgi:eukaryotic-like serine/threonine-protein kinase